MPTNRTEQLAKKSKFQEYMSLNGGRPKADARPDRGKGGESGEKGQKTKAQKMGWSTDTALPATGTDLEANTVPTTSDTSSTAPATSNLAGLSAASAYGNSGPSATGLSAATEAHNPGTTGGTSGAPFDPNALLFSGGAPTMTSWGVAPDQFSTLFDNPDAFLELWGQNTGNTHNATRQDDMEAAQSAFILDLVTGGGGPGNGLEYENAWLNNAATPGSSYMTMGDVSNALYNQGSGSMMGDISKGMQPDAEANYVNSMILGSTSAYMPAPAAAAFNAVLKQASTEYVAAVSTGYQGSYLDYLQQTGRSGMLTQGGV